MATENLNLNVNVNTPGLDNSLGSLKKQLREAQADVVKLSDKFGATSVQATAAAKKAAELKDRIADAKALTDSFNPDAKFKALTASLSGVAGGFGAVQGAMALFGAESDDVQKTLLKVQSAMAISQGLQSLGESIDSFKNLGAVIKSTTLFQEAYNFVIGKKVVVTQADIAVTQAQTASVVEQGIAIVGTTAVVQGATGAIGNKVVVAGTDIIAIEGQTVATVQHGVAVVATTTAVTGATTAMKAFRIALIASGIGLLIVAIGFAVEAFSKYIGAAEKAAESQKKLNERIAEGAKIQIDAETKFLDNQEKLDIAKAKAKGASEQKIYEIEQSYRRLRIESQQRHYQEVFKADTKAAKDIVDEINKINVEGQVAALEQQEKINIAKKEKEKEEKEQAKKFKEFTLNAKLQQQADDRALIEDGKKLEAEAAKLAEEDMIAGEQYIFDRSLKINKIKKDADDQALANKKEYDNAVLEAQYKLEDAKFSAVSAGLGMLESLAGRNEALANTIFIIDKAMAIAKIVVDTQREIAGYYSNPTWSAFPDGGLTIKTAASTGAKIRAGVSIATIAATSIAKFKGGGSGGGLGGASSGMPSISTQSPITPQIPTAATTNLSQQSINDIGNQAVRAYVIESDVTSNQQRITAIRQRARFS